MGRYQQNGTVYVGVVTDPEGDDKCLNAVLDMVVQGEVFPGSTFDLETKSMVFSNPSHMMLFNGDIGGVGSHDKKWLSLVARSMSGTQQVASTIGNRNGNMWILRLLADCPQFALKALAADHAYRWGVERDEDVGSYLTSEKRHGTKRAERIAAFRKSDLQNQGSEDKSSWYQQQWHAYVGWVDAKKESFSVYFAKQDTEKFISEGNVSTSGYTTKQINDAKKRICDLQKEDIQAYMKACMVWSEADEQSTYDICVSYFIKYLGRPGKSVQGETGKTTADLVALIMRNLYMQFFFSQTQNAPEKLNSLQQELAEDYGRVVAMHEAYEFCLDWIRPGGHLKTYLEKADLLVVVNGAVFAHGYPDEDAVKMIASKLAEQFPIYQEALEKASDTINLALIVENIYKAAMRAVLNTENVAEISAQAFQLMQFFSTHLLAPLCGKYTPWTQSLATSCQISKSTIEPGEAQVASETLWPGFEELEEIFEDALPPEEGDEEEDVNRTNLTLEWDMHSPGIQKQEMAEESDEEGEANSTNITLEWDTHSPAVAVQKQERGLESLVLMTCLRETILPGEEEADEEELQQGSGGIETQL